MYAYVIPKDIKANVHSSNILHPLPYTHLDQNRVEIVSVLLCFACWFSSNNLCIVLGDACTYTWVFSVWQSRQDMQVLAFLPSSYLPASNSLQQLKQLRDVSFPLEQRQQGFLINENNNKIKKHFVNNMHTPNFEKAAFFWQNKSICIKKCIVSATVKGRVIICTYIAFSLLSYLSHLPKMPWYKLRGSVCCQIPPSLVKSKCIRFKVDSISTKARSPSPALHCM